MVKKLIALILLASSLTANALIVNPSERNNMQCLEMAKANNIITEAFGVVLLCGMTTTTAPTYLIEGQETDMNSDEASVRLVAEAHGDAEVVLSSMIAKDLKIETSTVLETVISLEEMNQEVSVQAVLSEISKQ